MESEALLHGRGRSFRRYESVVAHAMKASGSIRRRPTGVLDVILDDEEHWKRHSPEIQDPMKGRSHSKPKSWMYTMFQSRSRARHARVYKFVITALILLNAVTFVFSTVPELQRSFGMWFFIVEAVTSSVFGVEYGARLVVITEKDRFGCHPLWGRLQYMMTFRAVVDALATFPFFVERISGHSLPTFTWLRVFRLLRILRGERYGRAMRSAYRVLYFNRHIFGVAGMICFLLVFTTSLLLYYLQPGEGSRNQEDDFSSLPATMYMSLLMLAGQGGPSGPLVRCSDTIRWQFQDLKTVEM